MDIEKIDINKIKRLYWEKEFNVAEIANKLNISFWSLYSFIKENKISLRPFSEVNYIVNKNKPQFKTKENLTIAEEKLKIAGIMLYWAEGTLRGNTIDFVNSNQEMIRIFLKFLREICGVSEKRLRVYLYAYDYHNLDDLKKYWSNITKIPLSQFTKPYIRRGNPNLSNRKLLYGLVHIRYNDKKLIVLIKDWIDKYKNWAGTQVAKGGRLSNGSVLSKAKMEK